MNTPTCPRKESTSGVKEKILDLHYERYALIENLQQIGDDIEDNPIEYELNGKIDRLSNEILSKIKEHFNDLPFEFIMEQLANLGQCPNLLNDDNGHWAVTGDGYQNVVTGDLPLNVETHFYVEAQYWKDTPREALELYLFEEE